ncbi:MAG: hypothetical protein HYZ31_03035 [Gammaproteobacteria bacterium]|nr:hypothetical protein [Gammaproteobacteria bacterium]
MTNRLFSLEWNKRNVNSRCNEAGFVVLNGIVNVTQGVRAMEKMRAGMHHGTVLRNNEQQQAKDNNVTFMGGAYFHFSW